MTYRMQEKRLCTWRRFHFTSSYVVAAGRKVPSLVKSAVHTEKISIVLWTLLLHDKDVGHSELAN
jgi:hypothetical protein